VSASSRTDADRWQQAKRILDEALERPADERADFILEASRGDEALRQDVESLAAADDTESILDAPVPVLLEEVAPRSRVGERVGAYELLSELGRGGMGVVYLARRADDEFQQKVAVKLVSGGLADEAALGRFRSERQISASLDHPHIARLLDGGATETGEPYFVMEYVEGEPLLRYCDARRLSTRERLRLFRDVCAAVQYAHQNLVVHRDLKPANVLVTGQGDAKLLDFGIAKLLDPGGAARGSPETATLYRMLTPDYASPEQVRGRPLTTASDIYALGVVLYELVAGRRPYHVESPEPEALLRLVCEQDPEKPSAVSGSRELRGDLDAIVLKAMRKEPERRYASAAALSDDLGRFLEGRPVEARRGSGAYRARKFIRRHRAVVAATALVLAALGGGAWATLSEARRARAAEARAERRFNDVRRLANSYLFEFHDAIRDLPGSTAARALLVKRALEYLDGLSKEAGGDRALRRELADAYQKVGDVQGNPFNANLGDMRGALESYGKAIALLEPAVQGQRALPEERSSLAAAYLVSGGIELAAGNPPRAVALARKGLGLREGLAAGSPGDARRQMELAQAWQWLAFDLGAAGEEKGAVEALARQRAILVDREKAAPADRSVRRSLGQNLYLTGDARTREGALQGALESYREATSVQESLLREDPTSVMLSRDLAYAYMAIGNTRLALGQAEQALEGYGRALSLFESMAAADAKSTDPILGIAMMHQNRAEAFAKLGRHREAAAAFQRALPRYEAVLAASPNNAWVAGMLATLCVELAELDAGADRASACRLYARALALLGPIASAGSLPPESRPIFERAKAGSEGCAGGR
jgi:tetratricopeptide (TPR) repeat protein